MSLKGKDFNIQSRIELGGRWCSGKTKSIGESTAFALSLISRHLISGILIILGICSPPYLALPSPKILY